MEFRNDIQGIRAIAVILVFIFHLSSSWMPGGFVGVDIFFVISGYLVSSIIMHKINKGTFSLVSFYESRIKRIVPPYFFFLLITSIFVAFLFVRSDITVFKKSLFWTLLFNSNNHFPTLDNYFGASSDENPLLHTWTLAVEMQFYFILPLILLYIKSKKNVITVLSIISLVLIGYSTYNIFNGKAGLMYFSLLSRMPEFLLGVIVSAANVRNFEFVKKNSTLISSLGLLIILGCSIFFNESLPFPGALAVIPCIGTIFILISSNNKINDFLSNRLFVYIGEISYSVYLWHWPIMALLRYHKNEYEFTSIEKLYVVAATIFASLLSYYLVEKTMRNAKGLKFYGPFLILSGATASMVLLTLTINKKIFNENEEFMSQKFGTMSHGPTFKRPEILGDTTQKDSKILLLGDSHALSMKKYLEVIGQKNEFSFVTITNNSFPTIPGIPESEIKDEKLIKQHTKLIEHVKPEIPKAKLIIVHFTGDGKKWLTPLKNFLSSLREDQKVIFLEDFPRIDKNPIRINKSIVKNHDIDQKYELIWNPISNEVLDLINSSKNSKYVRFSFDKVFDDAPFYKDTLMYYDRGHINTYGAEAYALETEDIIMDAINWGIK